MDAGTALELILHSPRLPEYAAVIARAVAEESQRRERFYAELSDEAKAEFIDGQVIWHSPAKSRHLLAFRNLFTLMQVWNLHRDGLVVGEKALCAFSRNDYEPDIVYFGAAKATSITLDTMTFPVPDLIVEVLSESTETRDRGVKFEDYAGHCVREYWLVDPQAEVVEQFLLADASGSGASSHTGGSVAGFQLHLRSGSGEIASQVMAGFVVPIRAIFDADAYRAALPRLLP